MDDLGGRQLICRETCCFVHLARKNILQPKEKWLRPFLWRSHLFFSIILTLLIEYIGIQ